jgi:predicted nucleic acid-binding protein
MDYLLDTTIISYGLEDDPAVTRRLAALLPHEHVYTSVVTEGELLYGAFRLRGARGPALLDMIRSFLATLEEVLPVTRAVAATYASIRQDLTARGQMIPVNDLWIAAIAASSGLTVVAHDKDFRRVDGLRLEDWLES